MMYNEDEYLMLSGIQHFVFCRRQWALIHIEQQWAENLRTADGAVMHRNVHDSTFNEKRRNVIIARAMAISSSRLGISGECDVVEFHRDDNGVEIFGREGKYTVTPIEYKRGKEKADECDIMQLTAQAMCLEDMLCCEVPFGYIYYGETRKRVKVEITDELKKRTESIIEEMHMFYRRKHTPKVKRTKSCNACSLNNICLPVICGNKKASEYIEEMLAEREVSKK